jgi:hypothetical protein
LQSITTTNSVDGLISRKVRHEDLNSKDYNGLAMYKNSLLTVHPKTALKAEFTSN